MAEDEHPTQLYEKAHWLKPVVSLADLPSVNVAEGAQCFVSGTGEIVRFVRGTWEVVPEED